MKVEIKLQPDLKSPYAVTYTGELTTEAHRAAAALAEEHADLVPAEEDDKIVMLHPEEIYLVRVGNEKTIIYTAKKQYQSNRRFYELEGILGRNSTRISKSAIMNLQLLDRVVPGLGGVMVLVLKNGLQGYASRKYLPDFKRYLGP